MSINHQIRAALNACGEAMNLDQLSDANGWSKEERAEACKRLSAMKSRGEVTSRIEDGKAAYAIVATYKPKKPGPKRAGPPIHVGRKDKTPKPDQVDQNTIATVELLDDIRSAIEPKAAGKPRRDFDLAKRIDAIAVDIEEALTDAVDSDHGKELLKHLIAAHGAVNRAARAYPRT